MPDMDEYWSSSHWQGWPGGLLTVVETQHTAIGRHHWYNWHPFAILARLYSIQYSWDQLFYCAFLPLRHRWWCYWRSWWRERDDWGQSLMSPNQNICKTKHCTVYQSNYFLWQLLVTTSCNYFLCLPLISTSRSNIASIFLFLCLPLFPTVDMSANISTNMAISILFWKQVRRQDQDSYKRSINPLRDFDKFYYCL